MSSTARTTPDVVTDDLVREDSRVRSARLARAA
jgi:hypothetical protein